MGKVLWSPNPNNVGNPEVIGRRIYFDKVLTGEIAQGKAARLRLDHFFDNRLTHDLSVDRLTRSGSPDRRVMHFLRPIATQANAVADFYGWGALKVRSLRDYRGRVLAEVLATPVVDRLDEPDNPFHADISREAFRLEAQALALATTLREIANRDFGIVGVTNLGKSTGNSSQGLFGRILKWIINKAGRLSF